MAAAVRSLHGGADIGLRPGAGRNAVDVPAAAHAIARAVPLPALDLKLNATQVGGPTVSYVRLGSGMHIDTVEAADYHVNLPLPGGTDSRSGRLERVQSTPRRAAVFLPGLPADIDWPGACAQSCLVFPRRTLELSSRRCWTGRCPSRSCSPPPWSGIGRAWVAALRLIERQAGYRPGLLETYARCTKPVLRRPLEPGQYLAIRYTRTAGRDRGGDLGRLPRRLLRL
ncbi:MAG: transcriptional regulator containing an amidase domain and an AraC-type DNA-binding domain [Modestobacter sp.]|nr:transcriptional regulator containing an amidase domain and an AraC-type DNA-binding domain [Modestobacter sp.]